MFQEIHENIFSLCLLFAISATLCALIFIFVGILAGSDGILKIQFEDFNFAQNLGIVAISYILFI